jgi:hypothetical protein
MEKYKNGKIYKLVGGGMVYYGSTIQKLNDRLNGHICKKRKYQEGKCSYVTSFSILDAEDCRIELVEEYPCNSKRELEAREKHYIQNNICVNKYIPTRTAKEYYENNIDKVKEYKKHWYEINLDRVKEYKKEWYKNNRKTSPPTAE